MSTESIALATRASYLAVAQQAHYGVEKHLAVAREYAEELEGALEDLNPMGTKANLAHEALALMDALSAKLQEIHDYL